MYSLVRITGLSANRRQKFSNKYANCGKRFKRFKISLLQASPSTGLIHREVKRIQLHHGDRRRRDFSARPFLLFFQ
ncbi:hypothetical protein ABK905_11555 [Acerihabitans sp. KWT182]|uniref:Uncharacterized protein n=1 Tax=Acerihabitans sp. KWT182 TaxID=3157919 RepID=A0AAU7QGP3_9GAMM